MLRTVTIVPTVTTNDRASYRSELEKINTYTNHVHIDISDGIFAPTTTLDVANVWWPKGWTADLHLMVERPSQYLETIYKLMPTLCILHAEVNEDLGPVFEALKNHGIKTGLALLPSTFPGAAERYINMVDHVMIFAGQLGMQGGQADMLQVEKIPLIRGIKAEVEIGWDGGANLTNIRAIAHSGIDVINVGSGLSKAGNPAETYNEMVAEVDKSGVVI